MSLLKLAIAASLALLVPPIAIAAAAAERDLDTAYRALRERLDARAQADLRDAERAWIAFRDKECAFRARGAKDGEAARSVCMAELARRRSEELGARLDCIERDGDCATPEIGSRAATQTPASANATASCREAAGAARAAEYVRECLQVSPATHPPCNDANPCALIVDEIERGCAMIDKDRPSFCADHSR